MELELLKKTAIFADLDEGELARVAEICKEQKYTGGQYVFKEGEPGNRFYLIVAGEVRISRNIPGSGEEALAVLKQGACFGEMAVFDRSERSTDAIANGPVTLMTISRPYGESLPTRMKADHCGDDCFWAAARRISFKATAGVSPALNRT